MNPFIKKLLVTGISAVLMAGCSSDDKKDESGPIIGKEDGNTDNPSGSIGSGGAYQELYGLRGSNLFMAQIIDRAGNPVDVAIDGVAEGENISVKPLKQPEIIGSMPLVSNVTVSEDHALFHLTTYSGEANLSAMSENGTLQFDLKVNNKAGDNGEVLLSLQDTSKRAFSIDLTSAVNAYGGAATQKVKVPFSCFDGIDMSESVVPFSIQSTAIDFDLGSVRVVPESVEQSHLLACDSESTVLDSSETDIFVRTYDGSNQREGWLIGSTGTHPDGKVNFNNTAEMKFAREVPAPVYDTDNGGTRPDGDVGVAFRMDKNADPNADISTFTESHSLEFDYYVNEELPQNRQLTAWISAVDLNSDKDDFRKPEFSSNKIVLEETSVKQWHKANLPLADFFTDEEGQISVDILRNLRNIVVETWSEDEAENTEYTKFYINNLRFVEK